MKQLTQIFLLLIISVNLSAQVGGISGSKLSAVCVDVVDHHKLEFEPSFYHVRSSQKWDSDGHLQNIFGSNDSINRNTGINFRMTYGLWDKLEIGGTISTDLQMSNWGLRYVLYEKKKLGFAVVAGANLPFGNKPIDQSIRLADNLISVGGGGVMSVQFNENLSLDVNAQYMAFTQKTKEDNKGSLYFNADLGYYIFEHQLQLIGSLAYQQTVFHDFTSKTLTAYPGFTLETGKNYILVMSIPFDIYGEHAIKNTGFIMALTLTFE